MTHALPAAPAPPPRRQLFVGTAIASAASLMLVGGMLALWILQRDRALDGGTEWLPRSVTLPEVAANVLLITVLCVPVFAQWAVYAAKRRDRVHVGLALSVVVILGFAAINAQAYIYSQAEIAVADSGYGAMFYGVTGAMVALLIIGVVFALVTMFRLLGGRDSDRELAAAHALYWYVLTVSFSAVWLIVYVTK
jgi:heme/copper-type cytochrome/quinol oxidase subunit 3